MKTKTFALIGAAILTLLTGCASTPIALSPVGPKPSGTSDFYGTGHLRVYSDTKTRTISEDNYYPHTGYIIRDQFGRLVKYVPNHLGYADEKPTLVTISAGKYNVVAESSAYGRVTVPVVIEDGKTTVLHLDRSWRPSSDIASNGLVRFPDGEAIGWSGSVTKASE